MTDFKASFLEFCKKAFVCEDIVEITSDLEQDELLSYCNLILDKRYAQKGVFTVLITLLFYKINFPLQDIRLHQTNLSNGSSSKNGFSGRSFDTNNITPVLKQLGLPSMAESGWLTRSLEQAVPYDLNYPGKISGGVKDSFLQIIHKVEVDGFPAYKVLTYLLNKSYAALSDNVISIKKIDNPDMISIHDLVCILDKQFHHNYGESGGAKLPMLAFHAIYQILLKELSKFEGCRLNDIGSYTASDRTSRTSGDLEIFYENGELCESIEIKLNVPINAQMVRRAKEKIYMYAPTRYYILSTSDAIQDSGEIQSIIEEIKETQGCQLILNGVLHTLKYYLRLIQNIEEFINKYSELIERDSELKRVHKLYWQKQIEEISRLNRPGFLGDLTF